MDDIQTVERFREDFLKRELAVGDHVLQQYNSPVRGQNFILRKIIRFTDKQCVLVNAVSNKRTAKGAYYAYADSLIKVPEEDVFVYLLKK